MSTPPPIAIRNARAVTLAGPAGPRRGTQMSDLGLIANADILLDGSRIAAIGPAGSIPLPANANVIDAQGRVVLPGFIDCHTHACYAGSRISEWELKLRGVPYLDILKAGGGIMSTVRATRDALGDSLTALTSHRLAAMLNAGTTTVEVKSGYGLSAQAELGMLRAITAASTTTAPTVIPTALLGHAIDGDHASFVHTTVTEALPLISHEYPGITIDAFCEVAAWSLGDTKSLFEAARAAGHPLRLHADQFNSLGGVELAIALSARSVDHLEASTDASLESLARSSTIGVGLPLCGFHLDGRYAKLRPLIDAGGAVAIATNFNPGSAPSFSVPFAIALAVRHCGLSPAEAIAAVTINAAAVLNLTDRGRLQPGLRADVIVLHDTDERSLAYAFANDPIHHVIANGQLIR